jgi:chromosome segregation protein
LDALRAAEAEDARTLARAIAERDASQRQHADLIRRAEAAEQRATQAQAEAATARARHAEAETRLDAAQAAMREAAEAKTRAEADEKAARTAAQTTAQTERQHMRALADAQGRAKALADLARRHVGVGAGSKAALTANLPGVVGVVTDQLDVPAAWEAAVAVALGDALTGVVVRDAAAAEAVLAWLLEKKKGRATLVRADAEPPTLHPLPNGSGVIGRLFDQLPDPSPLARALLSDVLVVKTVGEAWDADWPGVIVTPDGARLDRHVLRGGSQSADTSTLSRRREQKALAEQIGQLESARAQAESDRVAHEQARRLARQAIETARRAQHAAELARTEARGALNRAEAEAHRAEQLVEAGSADAQRLRTAAEEARARADAAASTARTAEQAGTDRDVSLSAADAAVQAAQATRDQAVAAVHAAKAERKARLAQLEAARDALNRLIREEKGLAESLARADKIRLTADTERRLFEERQTELAALLTEARADASGRASGVRSEREAAQKAADQLTDAETRVETARAARDARRDALTEARLAAQKHALQADHLAEQVQTRYRRSLGDVVTAFHNQPLPTPTDIERLTQLESLIERMGPVNLNAIEECAEVEERHGFLAGQRADLEAALDDLQTAIGRIDRTSRRLFAETFEAVNGHFQRLFPRLFRGGEAELALTDPDDLLGTGIEMRVQPPGKKVQNVGLLSGGEKALCAIALVFAVFHVKPSPFCLLDEVDAPLDDANIGRFNAVVREMAQMSQILLITHNKRTMEIADVLYGVTMEESGVSKLVGVRMDR